MLSKHFCGRKYFGISFLICLVYCGVACGQKETDTFTLNGQVTYNNGLQASANFRIIAENQRLKTGWFQQETLTKVETRKDGSYTISFLDIFGPNRTRVDDQIVVQVGANPNINQPILEIVYVVTSNDIENLEAELNLQLPAKLNPKLKFYFSFLYYY